MKGFLIIIFALCLFALAKFCCEEKRPDTELSGPEHTVQTRYTVA